MVSKSKEEAERDRAQPACWRGALDDRGFEVLDPEPMAVPVQFRRPLTTAEQVRQTLMDPELLAIFKKHGIESFEEAEDFDEDLDETFDRATPWEDRFDPDHPGVGARDQEIRHGVVADIPEDERKRAQAVLDAAKLERAAAKTKKGKRPRAKPIEESEEDSEEEA